MEKTLKDLLPEASLNLQLNTQSKTVHSEMNSSNINNNSISDGAIQTHVKTNEISKTVKKSLFELTNEIPDYEIFDKLLFENLSLYMQDLPNRFDLRKGLLFIGPTGTGKSKLMEILRGFGRKNDLMKTFRIENIRNIQTLFENKGGKEIEYFTRDIHLCIDDIGTESQNSKHFGNEVNIFEALIEGFYYYSFNRDGKLLHGTTNLTLEDFHTTYGDRVFDRMKKMFNPVLINNPSFRK